MEKILVLYKLREGITRDQFAKWSREVDQHAALQQGPCIRFELYAVKATPEVPRKASDALLDAFDIIEDIEVEGWDEWERALETDAMKAVLEQFHEHVDESSVLVVRGARLP
jgi:hypothetical protein